MNLDDLEGMPEAQLWELLNTTVASEKAEVAYILARKLLDKKEFNEALAVAETLVTLATEEQMDAFRAEGHFISGNCHSALDGELEAVAEFKLAADFFQKEGLEVLTAVSLSRAANSLNQLEQWTEALELAESALNIALANDELQIAGESELSRAAAHQALGNPDEALSAYARSRDYFRKISMVDRVLVVDNETGLLLQELEQHEAAVERFRGCLTMSRERNNDTETAHFAQMLGRSLVFSGMMESGVEYLQEARALAAQHNLWWVAGGAELDLAYAYYRNDDIAESYEYASRAHFQFDFNGDDSRAITAMVRMAVCLWAMQDYKKAARANQNVIELAKSDESLVSYLDAAVDRLAECHFALGENDTALEVLQQHVPTNPEDQKIFSKIFRLYLRARILWMRGDKAEAAELAQQALDLTVEEQVTFRTPHLYEILSEHYKEIDKERSDKNLLHAIALFLAFDNHDKATELSRQLLPQIPTYEQSLEQQAAAPQPVVG